MVLPDVPREDPGGVRHHQNFLLPEEPNPDADERYADIMKMYLDVVRDEDYYTGFRVQRALKTGAKDHSLFGRNEGGGQMCHKWVQALIDTEDEKPERPSREGYRRLVRTNAGERPSPSWRHQKERDRSDPAGKNAGRLAPARLMLARGCCYEGLRIHRQELARLRR